MPAEDSAFQQLAEGLRPTIADLGVEVDRVSLEYELDGETKTVLQYDTITNQRMLFEPQQDAVVREGVVARVRKPKRRWLHTAAVPATCSMR